MPPPDLAALAERFPHNEASQHAHVLLEADQRTSSAVLLVEPTADRARLVRLLARRASREERSTIRLLLGRPLELFQRWHAFREGEVEDAFLALWRKEGVSFEEATDILGAQDLAASGRLEVRIARQERPLASAAQRTDAAITIGATSAGLDEGFSQLVALARFAPENDAERYAEASALLEALWHSAVPFNLGSVLKRLLEVVSWERALARALALILEGAWARSYVAPHELSGLARPLLRHQLAGLGQALWILDHVGSVLVADPTGSGKTRLGAWILRAVYDRCARAGGALPQSPVMLSPPGQRKVWEEALSDDARLNWSVDSHGKLRTSPPGLPPTPLQRRIRAADVIAVDEAHNFHNRRSGRTRALLDHFADHVILFTATPINRSPADLHALVELLGPDHLSDEALQAVRRLRRPYGGLTDEERLRRLQEAVASFCVRRTRAEVDLQLRAEPEVGLRYPDRDVQLYEVACPPADLSRLERIAELAAQLKGVLFVGSVVERPPEIGAFQQTEEGYLKTLPLRCAALARFNVLSAVRSSRAAILELIHGTRAARDQLDLRSERTGKVDPTGDIVSRLRGAAGARLPRWNLSEEARVHAPRWLVDAEAHRQAALEDVEVYLQIAAQVSGLSDAGLESRADLLARLHQRDHKVLAFERRLITIDALHQTLMARGVEPDVFTGARLQARAHANRAFGPKSAPGARIALVSDAFSEGFNLQGADVVVHLDFPTVLRLGEQRSGRIDRMDSRHPQVQIWLPRDPEPLRPQEEEALIRRDRAAAGVLGGSNNQFPAELVHHPIDPEAVRQTIARREDELVSLDAFRPLRELIGPTGLVRQELYEKECSESEPLITSVCAVHGASEWALLALRGERGEAPRWVFLATPGARPVVDFRQISDRLRDALPLSTLERPQSDPMGELLGRHLKGLEKHQLELLPHSRRRAIELVIAHLMTVEGNFLAPGPHRERATDCLDVLQSRRRFADGRVPDPRALGDLCLALLRPLRDAWRADPKRRQQFFRLDKLEELLKLPEHALNVEALAQQLQQVPYVNPLRQRLFVAIVAVPAHREPSQPSPEGGESHESEPVA